MRGNHLNSCLLFGLFSAMLYFPVELLAENNSTKNSINTISKFERKVQSVESTSNNLDSMALEKPLARWELRTAPISLVAKWYTLELSYRISEKWAVGPTAVLYKGGDKYGNMFLPVYDGYAAGINSNYYFNSAKANGMYLSSHIYYEDFTSHPHHRQTGYFEKSGFSANAILGYQNRVSNIIFMTGGGLEYRNFKSVNKDKIEETWESGAYSTKENIVEEKRDILVFPTIEFRAGIEF